MKFFKPKKTDTEIQKASQQSVDLIDALERYRRIKNELDNFYQLFTENKWINCKMMFLPIDLRPIFLFKESQGIWIRYKVFIIESNVYSAASVIFYQKAEDFIIEEFQVTKVFQKKRIGSILLREIIEEAKMTTATKIIGNGLIEPEDINGVEQFFKKFDFNVKYDQATQLATIEKVINEVSGG